MIQRVVSYGQDSAAGRTPTYGAQTGPFLCSVQPTDSQTLDLSHGRQSLSTMHDVIFHDDMGLVLRDQVLLGSRILTVKDVLQSMGGRRNTWVYRCEERT